MVIPYINTLTPMYKEIKPQYDVVNIDGHTRDAHMFYDNDDTKVFLPYDSFRLLNTDIDLGNGIVAHGTFEEYDELFPDSKGVIYLCSIGDGEDLHDCVRIIIED